MTDAGRVRVGIVDYLNAWPLAWGFLTGAFADPFQAVFLAPADVANALATGRLDVGLVPSIEVQRIEGLAVVPDLCVAATHEVRSVILISERPLEQVRRVALDSNSRTSAALVRILLRDKYDTDAAVEEVPPDADEMLARADAALIIGDPALHVARDRYRVWDLAAEWRELTGLPFVFAVWAIRAPVLDRAAEIVAVLDKSLELGRREMAAIIERAHQELGLGADDLATYLTENLSYALNGEALAGLAEFYRRAAAHGLIGEATDIRLLETA